MRADPEIAELLEWVRLNTHPSSLPEGMTNQRNDCGVKSSCDMFRTFHGELYPQWITEPSPALIRLYRAAGVRCRMVQSELFVRQADQDVAQAVDAALREKGVDPWDYGR